ncbi:MAG: DNA polymerase III subunit alpha [Spirochaetia bacterium]|nr:DNA polymerase III subunit alpha [Spirochaetia bacterium]
MRVLRGARQPQREEARRKAGGRQQLSLAEHSEGLICLTACLAGEVQRKVVMGRMDEASNLAGRLSEMFPGRFFLEIQKHGIPEEDAAVRGNIEIAKRNGIPIAVTNDSHFLRKEDQAAQDILLRINQKKTMEDRLQFGFNSEFYVKSPQEMAALFPELPDAFHNTVRIAEMVDLNFQFGNPLLPKFDVPAGQTLDEYLRELAIEGLKRRYAELTPKIMERFEFEYSVITKMDFSGYFLIVQDFINWAKRNGIPVGPGRGSAAGSIISFALGITDIDPLRYDLLFERFLNPERKEMPDIDVDFCTDRREEVINYVREKYGRDRVGQIITYGTMAAKACLKDVARVLNIPFDEANQLSKKFPDVLNITLEDALKQSSELRQYAEQGEVQKKLFTFAKTLEGNVRNTGVHAAGVVISPLPLEDIVPMATVAAKSASGEKSGERVLVTQYEMSCLADVGLVKMDFLGLRNLTVIDNCVRAIEARTGQKIDMATLPLDDEKTYKSLHKGDVTGVFQLESSSGMREFVIRIQPTRFEDLIALIALFRPGPLQAGMAEAYINRKKGREKVVYPHADLEEILKDTYGVVVYQEQVMLVSRKIGGFTPAESDALRKAMGKKIVEKMAEMKGKFLAGAKAQGYGEKFADELYDQMAKFAEYGFNKSHSAAYAMVVYQTAYLKANFPTDYMRAVLDSERGKTEDLVPYINACKDMGIQILGPDVNESEAGFTYVKEGVIRFGLAAVKNVGEHAVESILEHRKLQGTFKSFFQFIENVDTRLCNRRALESLILAGSFDSLGYSRLALSTALEMALLHGQKVQEDKRSGQESLFGAFAGAASGGGATENIPKGPSVSELPEGERLAKEKEMLGFYLSGHPLAKYERALRSIHASTLESLWRRQNQDKVEVAGVITSVQFKPTKTGKQMARLVIEDMTSSMQAMIFPSALERNRGALQPDIPVMMKGKYLVNLSDFFSGTVKNIFKSKLFENSYLRFPSYEKNSK